MPIPPTTTRSLGATAPSRPRAELGMIVGAMAAAPAAPSAVAKNLRRGSFVTFALIAALLIELTAWPPDGCPRMPTAYLRGMPLSTPAPPNSPVQDGGGVLSMKSTTSSRRRHAVCWGGPNFAPAKEDCHVGLFAQEERAARHPRRHHGYRD